MEQNDWLEKNKDFFQGKQLLNSKLLRKYQMKTTHTFSALLFLMLFCSMAFAQIKKTVKITDFKPTKDDATAAVRAAIASGASTVIFDYPGYVYLVEPIKLRSDLELVFEDKVKVRAMPGKFHRLGASLFSGSWIKNVTLRGKGNAELTMNKKDYQDPKRYKHSEWRFTVALYSSENITVRDLKITSSGGDGVYIGSSNGPCKNILLENLVLDDHLRQGISIISAENLLVKNCKIMNTKGVRPEAGIDFEPNKPNEVLINNVIDGCEIYGNAYSGVLVALPRVLKKPISITIKNCKINNNAEGIRISLGPSKKDRHFKGTFNIQNCVIKENKNAQLLICGLRDENVKVTLRDVILKSTKAHSKPITIVSDANFGGLDLGNLIVKQTAFQNPFAVSVLGLMPIKGSLTLINEKGAKKLFNLAAFVKANTINPNSKNFKSAPLNTHNLKAATNKAVPGNNLVIRFAGKFIQCVKKGTPLKLKFFLRKMSRQDKIRRPFTVFNEDGKMVTKFIITEKEQSWEYMPKADGVLTFNFKPHADGITIHSNTPGNGFATNKRLFLFRTSVPLYFEVPPSLKTVMVKVCTSANAKISAELYDASGKLRTRKSLFTGHQLLSATREISEKPEIWKLYLFRASGNYNVQLGMPLRPIVSTHPANLIVEKINNQ